MTYEIEGTRQRGRIEEDLVRLYQGRHEIFDLSQNVHFRNTTTTTTSKWRKWKLGGKRLTQVHLENVR